jgi:hypothetical protein
MDEPLLTLLCLASLPNGALCHQPGVLFDCQRGLPVCPAHATFLTDEQRALIIDVLGIVARATQAASPTLGEASERQIRS